MTMTNEEIQQWTKKYPLLHQIMNVTPVTWLNPNLRNLMDTADMPVTYEDMIDAAERWQRFAPYLAKEFPETRETEGIVESPLKEIASMKHQLNDYYKADIAGALYLKCDNDLAIAGSIKARGGVYEVLYYAEQLALDAGLITLGDNYEVFAEPQMKEFFCNYSIGVGSTGNLGLSIGIMSAKLGFDVSVFMSADAKQWKKDLLREKGAHVHEFEGDFSEAITTGREMTVQKPNGYFVDDESSKHLFLGYSVAAFRLKEQLNTAGVTVDSEHPLVVHLPCGVGGSPGGIAFGLKQVFGDAAHCFFVEPTHAPAMLLGLLTGEKEKVSVQDFGLDNLTEGDGLAVGRPSSFASSISEQLVSGVYTMEDADMFRLLALLGDSEQIFVEPSAATGLLGPGKIKASDYLQQKGLDEAQATHIVWSTGGALVPEEDMQEFYEKGKKLL
ncbi:D-serine ammonia-lyase [Alkalicoccus daliensis]|uniref:Probable D-serine dehydratase n=1 Tax=Alkalicoccus daliensis TaxID=745820 RepID=A0A1H0G967_9BACI|nr:D-serine ammonia-lyase [Alkalicoccus daliensis]SDO03398.1 D-serine ammonia-lyase [Alkalicoccus daliensis]